MLIVIDTDLLYYSGVRRRWYDLHPMNVNMRHEVSGIHFLLNVQSEKTKNLGVL